MNWPELKNLGCDTVKPKNIFRQRLLVLAMVSLVTFVFISAQLSYSTLRGSPALSPSPGEWTRYTVKGEEFSVSLPVEPAMSSRKITLVRSRKQRTERILGSYAEGVAYAIYTSENAEGDSLDEFINQIKARRSRIRAWTDLTEIAVNGYAGKQITFTERGVTGSVQFFRTKDHLYNFEAVGASVDDPRMQRFFSSVTLGKKTSGVEVRDGIGAQPSENASDQSAEPFRPSEVDQRVVVVTKPNPSYTDSARQGSTKGVVILKAVFAGNGSVKNIEVISGLPFGLTEQALSAVKQIRFVPAIKNGKFVNVTMQLEYHFNLY